MGDDVVMADRVQVFVCCHGAAKPAAHMLSAPYVPVATGTGTSARSDIKLRDDTADSISEFNAYLNEATMIYWVARNHPLDCDWVGTAHYRHWLDIDYDNLIPGSVYAHPAWLGRSVYDHFVECGFGRDNIDHYIDLLRNRLPEYADSILHYLHDVDVLYHGNMFLMTRDDFVRYASFYTKCCMVAVDFCRDVFIPRIVNDGDQRNFGLIRIPGHILERMTGFWLWRMEENGAHMVHANMLSEDVAREHPACDVADASPALCLSTADKSPRLDITEPSRFFTVVGSGLFGAVVTHELTCRGYSVQVLETRDHVGGDCYSENVDGIEIHRYGAHIFRTDSDFVWDYVNRLDEFVPFVNSPIAVADGELYSLPLNMNTFYKLFGLSDPARVKDKIASQIVPMSSDSASLEDYALSVVGHDVYEKLIRRYSEKQWGMSCRDIPRSVMRRIPIRYSYDNDYYGCRYQGIPAHGYSNLIRRLLDGSDVHLSVSPDDVSLIVRSLTSVGSRTVWTGSIDDYYGYDIGRLAYRGVRFETERYDTDNKQGNAVINYCDMTVPYTRTIEHKHFLSNHGRLLSDLPYTFVTTEYPVPADGRQYRSYPVPDSANSILYRRYRERGDLERFVVFGGRLGSYEYTDMQDTVLNAVRLVDNITKERTVRA